MRILIQRVSEAAVKIDGAIHGAIDQGLLVLLGIETEDTHDDIDWLIQKISKLRIFSDTEGKMNLSVLDIAGSILAVSQFTLCANVKKGRRPSFANAKSPDISLDLYKKLTNEFRSKGVRTLEGLFGETMNVELNNDGPATFIINSNKL